MSFAARSQRTASRLVRHFGDSFTVTVTRRTVTVDPDTGGVTGTPTETEYTFPAVVTKFMERDVDGTNIQTGDRMVILDTTGAAITITDDDVLTINGRIVEIKRLMPLQPGDTLSTVRIHVAGF